MVHVDAQMRRAFQDTDLVWKREEARRMRAVSGSDQRTLKLITVTPKIEKEEFVACQLT
jgi:hypothetical protein